MRVLGRFGLVAASRQVRGQHPEKPGVRLAGQQGAEFAFHERLQPRIVPQQVQQTAQPQVGQSVE